jgi:mRNA interferase RelE/StbE
MPKRKEGALSDYRIFETDEFIKHLETLPEHDRVLIGRKLKGHAYPQLCENPFYGRNIAKLKAFEPPLRRYRIGDFRLFYAIDDAQKIVFMIILDSRKETSR